MRIPAEWLAVMLGAASIFCMGGVIFGIASLYPVLYYERALEASSCGVPALDDQGAACSVRTYDACCDGQQMRYTTITSIALFGADGAMLAYGEIGDRLGPRACFGNICWQPAATLAVMCSGYCADSVEGKEEKALVARRIEAMLDPAGCERRLKKGRRWETARGAGTRARRRM